MFKKIDTLEELAEFNHIFTDVYKKRNYKFTIPKILDNHTERYLIYENNNAIGTVELVKYNPTLSQNEKAFPFSELPIIQKNIDAVLEIQKVTILDIYQSKGFFKYTINAVADCALRNKSKVIIALLDRNLYLALRNLYRISVEKLGDKFFYKGHYVFPVSINVQQEYQTLQQQVWFE